MAFYVKLGPRGILFRLGTGLIGVLGSWVYWRASRRRGKMIVLSDHPALRPTVARPRVEINATSTF